MTEVSPGFSSDNERDEKIFWDMFFHHLDKLKTAGIRIDQDKIVEIAKISDSEAAKRFLFYTIIGSQPTESSAGDFKEILNFLVKVGYIDLEDKLGPPADLEDY